jgi:metal iron transporter
MFASHTDASDQGAIHTSPVVVEKSVGPNVHQDVSIDVKKVSNVKVLETVDSPMESIISTHEQYAQQTVGTRLQKWRAVLVKFARFTGPGTLISVAYVDPDNFQTALDAGAQFQYTLLFVILIGVLMAVFLQVSSTVLSKSNVLMGSRHLPRNWDVSRV